MSPKDKSPWNIFRIPSAIANLFGGGQGNAAKNDSQLAETMSKKYGVSFSESQIMQLRQQAGLNWQAVPDKQISEEIDKMLSKMAQSGEFDIHDVSEHVQDNVESGEYTQDGVEISLQTPVAKTDKELADLMSKKIPGCNFTEKDIAGTREQLGLNWQEAPDQEITEKIDRTLSNWARNEGFDVQDSYSLELNKAGSEEELESLKAMLDEAYSEPIPEEADDAPVSEYPEDIAADLEAFEEMSANPKNMFDGDPDAATMPPGTLLERYGYEGGYYLSTFGTPEEKVALPGKTGQRPHHYYRVEKPFDYISGTVEPIFGKEGGAEQILTGRRTDENNRDDPGAFGGRSVKELLNEGYLVEVDKNGRPLTKEQAEAYGAASEKMADYMRQHNYGNEDAEIFSKDPQWQKLNADMERSLGNEVPEPAETKDSGSIPDPRVSVEHPKNCLVVDPNSIDMTYAMGMDSDRFWNHHGNTKEDYIQIAEKIPQVQKELDSGKTLEEIRKNPELQSTVHAYFDPGNMVKVEVNQDGSYSFVDDGRHRVMAARECGCQIPVKVENMPETVETQDVQVAAEPTVMQTVETGMEQPAETVYDKNGTPLTDEEAKRYRAAMNHMADYLSEHNYGREDYGTYSKDPEWQKLNAELQESLGMEVTQYPDTKESAEARYRNAMDNMGKYLSEHNYGREDYGTYSKDPEWQKLNEELKEAIRQKEEFRENPDAEETQKDPEQKPDSEEKQEDPETKPDSEEEQEDPEQKLDSEEKQEDPETKTDSEEKQEEPEQKPDSEEKQEDPETKPDSEEEQEDPEQKPDSEEEQEDPEQKTDSEEKQEDPEQKPDSEEKQEDPEQKPDSEEKQEEPEQKPDSEEKQEDPEQKTDSEEKQEDPEQKPDSEEKQEDPEQKPDSEEKQEDPEQKPDSEEKQEDPETKTDSEEEQEDPEQKPDSEEEQEDPEQNPDSEEKQEDPEQKTDSEEKQEDPEKRPDSEEKQEDPEKKSDSEEKQEDPEKKPESEEEPEDPEKEPDSVEEQEDPEQKPDSEEEQEDPEQNPDSEDKQENPDKMIPPDDLNVENPKKNETNNETGNEKLATDDLNVENPKNETQNEAGNEVLTPDDLNVENKQDNQDSDLKESLQIDAITIYDAQGNPLSGEEQEKYYAAMNDLADYHEEHGTTPQDYDQYSQDPQWQEKNKKLLEVLKKDDLNVDEKKKEEKKEEELKRDDLTTGDQNQDNPDKNKVEEPPKVDPPEPPDGGDGGGNRR